MSYLGLAISLFPLIVPYKSRSGTGLLAIDEGLPAGRDGVPPAVILMYRVVLLGVPRQGRGDLGYH